MNKRVYSKSIQANGEIIGVDAGYFKVRFFWAAYCRHHNLNEDNYIYRKKMRVNGIPEHQRKWAWCSKEDLVPGVYPFDGPNSIGLVNKRVTDKRLHTVCEIPYMDHYTDIAIRYGGNLNYIPVKLCINEKIVLDKFEQMQLLGEELANRSTHVAPDARDLHNWIVKPHRSYGGKNIKSCENGARVRPGLDYYQKKFNKVREFRAHAFLWNDGILPFIQEKVIHDKNQLCWNKKQGGSFRYIYQPGLDYGDFINTIDRDTVDRMREMSKEALKRLHYDSGGIDFGMDGEGNLKIFEVNSAMGLRERSLWTYKNAFWELATLDINDYKQKRGW